MIDGGETVSSAAIRELKEETGYTGVVVDDGEMLLAIDPSSSNQTQKLVTIHVSKLSSIRKDPSTIPKYLTRSQTFFRRGMEPKISYVNIALLKINL